AGVDGPVVDQRAAGMVDERYPVEVPGAELRDLADAAARRVLMAFAARLGVVHRSEPVGDRLALVEDRASGVEVGLGQEAVGQVVEARGGFGNGLTLDKSHPSCRCHEGEAAETESDKSSESHLLLWSSFFGAGCWARKLPALRDRRRVAVPRHPHS